MIATRDRTRNFVGEVDELLVIQFSINHIK